MTYNAHHQVVEDVCEECNNTLVTFIHGCRKEHLRGYDEEQDV